MTTIFSAGESSLSSLDSDDEGGSPPPYIVIGGTAIWAERMGWIDAGKWISGGDYLVAAPMRNGIFSVWEAVEYEPDQPHYDALLKAALALLAITE
jgi:hypothetical protein